MIGWNGHGEAKPLVLQRFHRTVAVGFGNAVTEQFYQPGAVFIFTSYPAKIGGRTEHRFKRAEDAGAAFDQRAKIRQRLGDAVKPLVRQIRIGFIKGHILFDFFDAGLAPAFNCSLNDCKICN